MNDKFKYLIVSLFCAATLSYGIMKYHAELAYLKDYIYGTYLELAETFFPLPENFTIINNRAYKKYVKTFTHLPRGSVHAGGIVLYQVHGTRDLDELAPDLIRYSEYYSESRLKSDMKKYNGLASNRLRENMTVIVPDAAPALIIDTKNHSKPQLIAAKGLYFTGTSAGSPKFIDNLERYGKQGINTVVFDAKDITGIVNYYSRVNEVRKYDTHGKRTIGNIEKLIRMLKEI